MSTPQSVAIKIRTALQQIDAIPPSVGVPAQQLNFVKQVLQDYLIRVEAAPQSLIHCDLNLVSRLVVEYWPIELEAGEAIIEAEHAVRKLAQK